MAIVTVEQLRQYLDQVKVSTTIDTTLEQILARAEGIVTSALGFAFFDAADSWASTVATTKYVTSDRSKYLKLPAYLQGSITSIVTVTGNGSTRTLDTNEIVDYDEIAKQYLEREAGWGGIRYAVTAKYGYGPAPAEIVQLVLEVAVNAWRLKSQGLFQVTAGVAQTNNAVGGGAIKFVGGLNADQRKIIANVRRHYVEIVH